MLALLNKYRCKQRFWGFSTFPCHKSILEVVRILRTRWAYKKFSLAFGYRLVCKGFQMEAKQIQKSQILVVTGGSNIFNPEIQCKWEMTVLDLKEVSAAIQDTRKVCLIHMNGHYCLLYGVRIFKKMDQWQFLTSPADQMPRIWVSWSKLKKHFLDWQQTFCRIWIVSAK